MNELATQLESMGFNVMIFNGYGGSSIKVNKKVYKTKGKRFNETLFYIYKMLNMGDKPLVIIGRRKVDRGLGFHYCPRMNEFGEYDETIIEGFDVPLINNGESLLWTDLILGRIEDKNTAVQKAGRGAGIIGHSPDYTPVHYWTDDYTSNLIIRHNKIVDVTNNITGYTAFASYAMAEEIIPEKKINHTVSLDTFLVYDDMDIVKDVCKELKYQFTLPKKNSKGFYETSLNTKKETVDILQAIKKVPTAYGKNDGKITYRTYYPCYKDVNDSDTLHFVIIIRPEDTIKIPSIETLYPSIKIPQEGAY